VVRDLYSFTVRFIDLHLFTYELSASEATDKLFDGSSSCYVLQEVLFK
jgi:hypothetical protein